MHAHCSYDYAVIRVVPRVDRELSLDLKRKIGHFTNVPMDAVIAATDVSCIYELPICLHKEGLDQQLVERLNIWSRQRAIFECSPGTSFSCPRKNDVSIRSNFRSILAHSESARGTLGDSLKP